MGKFFFPWSKPKYEVNFVTSFRLKKLARDNGLEFKLKRNVMASYVSRLSEDPVFASRLKRFALVKYAAPLFRLVPSWAGSPMIALFHKPL